MRKTLLIVGSLLFTGALVFMSLKIVSKSKENERVKTSRQQLPDFLFYNLHFLLSEQRTPKGIPVCIVYFNTECDHCHNEAEQINKHITDFKNAEIVMVSPNPPKDILAFSNQYQLSKHKQITLLWDKDDKFRSWFGNASFPSVYIYNKDYHLMKEYHGEVKIEAITKYLQ